MSQAMFSACILKVNSNFQHIAAMTVPYHVRGVHEVQAFAMILDVLWI